MYLYQHLGKKHVLDRKSNSTNLCISDCHLAKKSQIYVINRLNSIELYAMQKDYSDNSKPTSQVYFESLFKTALDWTEICLMPQKATISTRMVTKKVAIPLECFNIKWQCIIYK